MHNKNCKQQRLQHLKRRKVLKMQNAKKGKATQNATAKPATVKAATLQHTGNEVTYADIWVFVQQHAGGNLHNV